jgi:SNF2 family DNA or RNA helicase
VPQKDGYDKARRLLVPSVRYSIEDIWDGPEMTVQRRKVDLTDEQKKLMLQLKNELQIMTKAGPIDAANEAAARQKFMQISLGAVYDGQHNAHVIDASPRYKAIAEIVEETERKVLVFVTMTSVIHELVKFFEKLWKAEKSAFTCGFINGEVPAKQRPGLIRRFESDPTFKIMFADPQATAHGINEFVCADTVIWASATDKAELWIQGNRRVRRQGQKYPTTCHQIVSNKLEEEIFDRLETNTGMQGLMLDAIRSGKF